MGSTIATDKSFGTSREALLRDLAGRMIPSWRDFPSAADARIFADVLSMLAQHPRLVAQGLSVLSQMVNDRPLAELKDSELTAMVGELREEVGAFVNLFESSVAACYYRDDRVLLALALPQRAPFPEGNEVVATDWSLLDPVRRRPPFFKQI